MYSSLNCTRLTQHNMTFLTLHPLTVRTALLKSASHQYIEWPPCELLSASVNLTVMEFFTPREFSGMGIFFISLSHCRHGARARSPQPRQTVKSRVCTQSRTHSPLLPASHRAEGTDGSEKSFTRYCTFHMPKKKTLSVRSSPPITPLKSPATAPRSAGGRRKLGY